MCRIEEREEMSWERQELRDINNREEAGKGRMEVGEWRRGWENGEGGDGRIEKRVTEMERGEGVRMEKFGRRMKKGGGRR
jgi:hypothetical protein